MAERKLQSEPWWDTSASLHAQVLTNLEKNAASAMAQM
jgi:hypothetical protein